MKALALLATVTVVGVLAAGCTTEEPWREMLRNASVGDCLSNTPGLDGGWEQEEDCEEIDAHGYKIAAHEHALDPTLCDDVPEADVIYELRDEDEPWTICLQLLPKVGECTGHPGFYIACPESGGMEIVEVHEDTTDGEVCESGSPRVYEADRRVVCNRNR